MYTRIGTANYKTKNKIFRFFANILLQTYLGCLNGEGGGVGLGEAAAIGVKALN